MMDSHVKKDLIDEGGVFIGLPFDKVSEGYNATFGRKNVSEWFETFLQRETAIGTTGSDR